MFYQYLCFFFFSHIWVRFVFLYYHVTSITEPMNCVYLVLAAVSEPPGGSGFIAVAFVTPAVLVSYVRNHKIILKQLALQQRLTSMLCSTLISPCTMHSILSLFNSNNTYTEVSYSQVIQPEVYLSESTQSCFNQEIRKMIDCQRSPYRQE